MNAKIFRFVNCVEGIVYLLLYNLHDCTLNQNFDESEQFLRYSLKNAKDVYSVY